MLRTIQGNLYDYPKYYDLVYARGWFLPLGVG